MSPPPAVVAAAGPGETPVPAWLRGLPRAPEYRPTESEFADPIAFLSRVEREAAAYGICKVIPPYQRPSRRFVFAHLNRSLTSSSDAANPAVSGSSSSTAPSRPESAAVFTTRHQELGTPRRGRPPPQVLKQVWQSGEQYTLEQFEAKSRAFSKVHLAGLREPTPLEVESLFWKASADRPIYIEYANDVPGSGFAAPPQSRRRKKRRREGDQVEEVEKGSGWRLSGSPWNLQAIARAPGSLTRFMPDDVPGVTSPMVYIGMLFSWFAWHVEDHELHSLNFLHTGAPKTWYAVPGDRASELEEVIRVHGYGGNPDRLASLAVLGEKTTLMSPDVLVARGVPCCRLVQYPGEFVVTFPRAYHIGFSHGFNCGEAANFATPQWLKFAKEAAVRRAVMNYLPMLSHQQLLYLLAASFIIRTPSVLSGIRTSRLRDRRKEERELLVKQEFLQDMINENKLLCSFLKKKSIDNVVLWEPDLLPSSTVLNSSSFGSKAPEKKSEDGCRIESSQCNHKDNSSFDCSVLMTGTQIKCMSANSKSSDAASASVEKFDADTDDEDDLPFDLSIDSGSLTCVACGILGYPFMAILQPSREAFEGISPVHREKFKLSSEKEKSANVLPCCPAGSNSGSSFIPNRPSCSVEQPCLATPAEQANIDHQNVKSRKDVCLPENELAGPVQQHSDSSYYCRSENTLYSCSNWKKSDNTIPKDSLGPEVKQTGRCDINVQAVESCDGTINWNTSSTFARPRIFCLQHALEIEELFEGKGGVHALIICHSDYTKLKALAISIAEEIEFQFDCTDVPLANASKSDLHLINISIDDEGHEEDGKDWTSQMGLNLKYCAKLRKETSGIQDQSPLSVWGLFSNPSPVSVVPNLKWLCRKARTPYKVIGVISSSSTTAIAGEVKPEVKKETGTTGNVCEDDNSQHIFQKDDLLQPSGLHDSDDRDNRPSCSKENDHDRHCLIDIPIAVAEYPLKHQVCEGPVSISMRNDTICSSDSQDSSLLATSPVDVTRYQGCTKSTELSCSSTFCVQQFLNDESTSVEGSMNCISNHEYLKSQDVTLRCRDECLQVQQDQEEMGLCNNPNRTSADPCLKEDLAISEEKHGGTVSAALENDEGCAKTSNCSDKTNESATVNPLETHDVGAVPVKQKTSCDGMTCSADVQCIITFGCLGSSDVPGSTQPLSVPHDLMSDELQVDSHHCVVKAIEPESNDSAKHGSPQIDYLISEDAQAASMTALPVHDGISLHTGSNSFDILLGALAEESKVTDAPGKDEVGKASLTLMTLASNDHSADEIAQGKIVEVAKRETIFGATKDNQQVDCPYDFCLSDLVSRSIGNSNRTDIICYFRRKRKKDSQSNTDSSQSLGSFVRSPCESLRPRTKPAVVETVEVSAGKKGKRAKVGSFQCDIDLCDMAFETRAELNAHKRNICTDESCGKRFSSHKYLKRHQCVHSEIRPFKCPWDGCEMTFKWLWAQTEHVRVHTGERPYKCSAPSCGQTFRYVSDYSRHRKKFNHY
ncbi:lysine-specific demethylase SE14-like [Panicum miliaceum]|uniref:Lysine-specific demethylase SE14-like n=1 Tax=Panicum miliaceum TaxID=4540 RepID=A0A3L6SH78_PANMI|nr:lysine-specific demethylase SE14-like [Panicum miliaceum]